MVNAADDAFTEDGLLAETVAVPEDRSWVEFTLHGDARWHDGKPITVEDVIWRSEEHTSELQSLMRISYAVFCLKKKKNNTPTMGNSTMFTWSPSTPIISNEIPHTTSTKSTQH